MEAMLNIFGKPRRLEWHAGRQREHKGQKRTELHFKNAHQEADRHLAGSSSTLTSGTLSTPASFFIRSTYSATASCSQEDLLVRKQAMLERYKEGGNALEHMYTISV